MLKGILKAVRFVASATVGLPLALAASVVVGTTALTLRAMDKCWSEFYKKAFSTDVVPNAFLKGAADASFAAFATIWTGFGFYAFKEAAVGINNRMGRVASTLGFTNHDQFYASSWKDHLTSAAVEEAAAEKARTEEVKAIKKQQQKEAKDEKKEEKAAKKYLVEKPQGSNLRRNSAVQTEGEDVTLASHRQ